MNNSRTRFRLMLWIFMTFVAGYMLVFVITHNAPQWKIIVHTLLFIIGLIFCLLIYKAGKKED